MPKEELEDRIALQDLLPKYAAAVDDRNLTLYRSCFCEDVEVINFGTQTYQGLEDWIGYVWTALEKYSASQHMLGPPLITVEGDQARLRTDVQALHVYKDKSEATTATLWATYETDARRVDGTWKICKHRLIVKNTKVE